MSHRLSRRFVLAGLAALTVPATGLAGAPITSLRPRMRGTGPQARTLAGIETLIAAAGVSGRVACAVADVNSGLRLEAVDGDLALPPASVAKAITALYALEVLGADYRFATQVLAAGTVQNGILNGDLILAGGGDPMLTTNHLAALAAQLKAAGVREVRGAFRVYDGALPYVRSIDEDQPDQLGYSPAVAGIALNFNRVHFEWKRAGSGYAISMDARTERYRPEVEMARMRVAARETPVYTYKDGGSTDEWTVASAALGKSGSRWLPVRKPGLYAGDVFRTMARSHGIVLKAASVGGGLPGGVRVLAQTSSPPLVEILRDMLKFSNNLTAEMVGMTASARAGGKPASLKESAARMSRWAGQTYGMRNTRLVDHSGLGEDSRMTAEDLVGALVQVRQQKLLRPLLKPIPMRDANGRTLKSHPIKVDAKTGTLNFVSGLGGFMTAPDGTELAFAIFAADTGARARISPAEREGPPGARTWNGRAKRLQQQLIERWGALYGG